MFPLLAMMPGDQPSVGARRRSFPRHLLHRTTLAIAAVAAFVGHFIHTQPVNADQASRPNIVLIMADDMGYECLSVHGSDTYRTPRLDALARGGMRFAHCHSQPICTPSRVQIMTGMYNNRNYIRFGLLDPKATTFAHLLKRAGYTTCIAGKWQLLGGFDGPRKFGFDEYCLWQLTRRPGRYVNPGLEINGKQVDFDKGEYGPDIVSDYLCDFMARNKDRPFFAYYPMILPHWPFEPTPDSPDYDKTSKGKKGKGDPEYFPDMVAYTDKLVGKLADKLDELGIRENTLLLFTCDNGTYAGITSQLNGQPYPGGKGHTSDNGTHVPLVASWPGVVPEGKVCDPLVDFSDILPTLCDVGSAAIPSALGLEGHSILPLLRGETSSPRSWIYCWYERNGRRGQEQQLVRDRAYKLYADGRMFHVASDLLEKRPLDTGALSAEAQEAYERLKPPLARQIAVTKEATEALRARGVLGSGGKKKRSPKAAKSKDP